MKNTFEQSILDNILKTFQFTYSGKLNKWVKCSICNKRLMVNYLGKPLNERVIEHAKGH